MPRSTWKGPKPPDNEFKDFKNHVLHVRDGYWGGALEAVEKWYGELVGALSRQSWVEAVRAAGILSHYVCDPVHPFHTAQSEAENNIHRACEWSISKSYDDLLKIGETGGPQLELTVAAGDTWLRELMCRGAEIANANYERLIAHYDIHRGVSDPPAGLDSVARGLVADLIVYAARANAAILDRAFAAAGVSPPEVSLTAETVVAALEIPKKWLSRKLANAEDRRLVEAMYDELKTTGRVEQNLPADDRIVRELHRVEVLANQTAALEQQRARIVKAAAPLTMPLKATGVQSAPRAASAPIAAAGAPPPQVAPSLLPPKAAATGPVQQVPTPPPAPVNPPSHLQPAPKALDAAKAQGATGPSPYPGPSVARPVIPVPPSHAAPLKPAGQAPATEPMGTPPTIQPAFVPTPPPPATQAAPLTPAPVFSIPRPTVPMMPLAGAPEARLTPADDVEKAPSIGPKTAERLAGVGIKTVAQFLAADPATVAEQLDVRHITSATITDWKDQARLVMRVPGLRGTHAQFLVGSGYRTAEAIAAVAPEKLCADVLAYAGSPDGQRLLRDGSPPDVGKIKGWIASAAAAKAA